MFSSFVHCHFFVVVVVFHALQGMVKTVSMTRDFSKSHFQDHVDVIVLSVERISLPWYAISISD